MELSAVSENVHLAAYSPRVPPSVASGNTTTEGFKESGYRGGGTGAHVLAGYETLDTPPHCDFYAHTEVWGRRRRLRPSLYQLYASPEVRILCSLSAFIHLIAIQFMF